MTGLFMWFLDARDGTTWYLESNDFTIKLNGSYIEMWCKALEYAPHDWEHRNDLLVPGTSIKADHAWIPVE